MSNNTSVTWANLEALFQRQLIAWPLLRDNYKKYEQVQVETVQLEGVTIQTQYNPSRIISSAARTDKESLSKRKCFLCLENLPPEQEFLLFEDKYRILCNPYPVFPRHYVIATVEHTDQSIINRLGDMLSLSKQLKECTIFYNGPASGASAPDHLHFQAATKGYMPIDAIDPRHIQLSRQKGDASFYTLTNYLRNGFIIRAASREGILYFFNQLWEVLEILPQETEPRMNLFCNYSDGWELKVIPRIKHRPRHFYARGDDSFLSSPGAADIGGTFIISREEDLALEKNSNLTAIYQEVCYSSSYIFNRTKLMPADKSHQG